MPRFSTPAVRAALPVLLFVGLFLGLHLVRIEADPPAGRLPNRVDSQELWVEGAAKAHEARNWALFGQWKTNEVDNYQFWRAQSPVWVYPLAAFFKAFGVSNVKLRLYSVLIGALGLFVFLVLARRRLKGWPFVVAGALLSCNYFYILFTRSGVLEPAVNLYGLIAIWALLNAWERGIGWLPVAQLALVAAFLSKMIAVVLLPAALVATVVVHVKALRQRAAWWKQALPVALAIGLLVFLYFYVTQEAYWRTLVWNYSTAVQNDADATAVNPESTDVADALARLFDWEVIQRRWWVMPVGATLAGVGLLGVGYRALRRKVDPWDLLTGLWLVVTLGALAWTERYFVRYTMVALPPAALLAGRALEHILERVGDRRTLREAVVIAAIGLLGATQGGWYLRWLRNPHTTVVDANRRIEHRIGDRPAVVAGQWAPWLVFDTPYQYYYVKHRFNTKQENIARLGITHVLLGERDVVRHTLRRQFPDYYGYLSGLDAFRIRRRKLTLYEVWPQLPAPENN